MFKRILVGMKSWFNGSFFVIKHPSLWKFLAFPLIINFIIVSVLFVFGWKNVITSLPDVAFQFDVADIKWWLYVFLWCKAFFIFAWKFLLKCIVTTVMFIVFVLVYVFLASVTGAPFYDRLSYNIEKIMGSTIEDPPFSVKNSVLYPLFNTLKVTCFEIVLAIVLFPLNWVPVIGSLFYVFLISFPVGVGFICYSTERRLWRFKDLLKFSWNFKYELIGFGMVAFVSMIPFGLNMVTFPLSAAGGTVLFFKKCNNEGQVEKGSGY